MSDFTTNLQLPYLMPAQAQKHVTVNEALRRMDALVQMRAQSRTTAAQPASPDDGQMWILPAGKSGADWGGFTAGRIAYYRDGAWEEITPRLGWFAFIVDLDELNVYSAAGWVSAMEASGALIESEFADPAAVRAINQGLATASTPAFAGLTLSSPMAVMHGGTGAASAADARANLGAQAALGFTPVNKSGDVMNATLQIGAGDVDYAANLLIRTSGAFGGNGLVITAAGSGHIALAPHVRHNSSYFAYFLYGAGAGSQVGAITTNGTATTYGTTSDGRLKDNIQPLEDSGAIIDALSPCRFDWNHVPGGPGGVGFVAQDLAAAVPEAVFQGDGDPMLRPGDEGFVQWSVDMAKLVPYLVAEVRSLRVRVAALEGASA